MQIKVFVINGYAESGKDTFVQFCKDAYPFVLNVSMVDFAKEIAKQCGWNGKKEDKDRKFLADLKDLMDRYNNASFNYVDHKIYCYERDLNSQQVDGTVIVFIHSRQPEDIEYLCGKYNATTIFIDRKHETVYSNHADLDVENYDYDMYIDNNGTLADLQSKAVEFVRFFGI